MIGIFIFPLIFLLIFIIFPLMTGYQAFRGNRLDKKEKLIKESGDKLINNIEKEFEAINNNDSSFGIIVCKECGVVRFSETIECRNCFKKS